MEQYTIDGPWCKMPLEVMFDKRLSPADKQVYTIIAYKAGMRGWFWAKQSDLAERMSLVRETMARSVAKLREYGYIHTWQREKSGLLCYAVGAHTKTFTPNMDDAPIDDLANDPVLPPPPGANPVRDALVQTATDLFGPARTKSEAARRSAIIDELLAANITPDELRRATECARATWKHRPTLRSVADKIGELLAAANAVTTVAADNPTAHDEAARARRAKDAAKGIFYPTHPAGHKCEKCREGKRQWQQEQSVATMQPQPPERVSAI